MKEWSETVWIGVSLAIACAIVVILSTMNYQGKRIINEVYVQRRSTEVMQEYRKNYQYDNKEVYASDATSLIIELKGTIPVKVLNKDGTTKTWTDAKEATAKKAAEVLNPNSMYKANITIDANGAVVEYSFTEV